MPSRRCAMAPLSAAAGLGRIGRRWGPERTERRTPGSADRLMPRPAGSVGWSDDHLRRRPGPRPGLRRGRSDSRRAAGHARDPARELRRAAGTGSGPVPDRRLLARRPVAAGPVRAAGPRLSERHRRGASGLPRRPSPCAPGQRGRVAGGGARAVVPACSARTGLLLGGLPAVLRRPGRAADGAEPDCGRRAHRGGDRHPGSARRHGGVSAPGRSSARSSARCSP